MRIPITLAACALVLAACGIPEPRHPQPQPDLTPQIDSVAQLGDRFRSCEVDPHSPTCLRAAGDAAKVAADVRASYESAGVAGDPEAQWALSRLNSWTAWHDRCDTGPHDDAGWCRDNAPDEAEADNAAQLLRNASGA